MTLPKFRVGNIILSPYGSVEIVTNITRTHLHYISAKSSNVSGAGELEQKVELMSCFQCIDCDESPDENCKHCYGTGECEKIHPGWNESIVLADSMYDYIHKKMMHQLFPEFKNG